MAVQVNAKKQLELAHARGLRLRLTYERPDERVYESVPVRVDHLHVSPAGWMVAVEPVTGSGHYHLPVDAITRVEVLVDPEDEAFIEGIIGSDFPD